MDDLFNQMANISKAHGYDILADHVKELKQANKELVQGLEAMENKICELYRRLIKESESNPTFQGKEVWEEEKKYIETVTEPLIKKAKLLSI